ncbi:hypothetical protein [Devosia sp. MC521]|uniref:hypothetical protein n=1 Tax=Devosia sp. MC521 TaxID=2759954 RepID=UPI0015FB5E12|nr:hypothetical protein [Devosia sp. MC521]MBJ6986299.1 hypothetical protein [Devosia sp. MC521]QMW64221.1 hypothetical protein H4N61_07950 [Devosia sp. MC521]
MNLAASAFSMPGTTLDLPGCGLSILTEATAKVEPQVLGPDKSRYLVEWLVTNSEWSQAFPNSLYGLVQFRITCTRMTRWLDDAATYNRIQANAAHDRALAAEGSGMHEGEDHFTAAEAMPYGALSHAHQIAWEHTSPSHYGTSRHHHVDVYGSHGKMRIHVLAHFVGFDLSDNPELAAAGTKLTAADGSEVIAGSPVLPLKNGGHVVSSTAEQNMAYLKYVLGSTRALTVQTESGLPS